MSLEILEQQVGGKATLELTGEIDVSNADELRSALSSLEAAQVDEIVVNLGGVPYIDSTGIGVLVGAANRAKEAGFGFKTIALQPNVSRVIGLLDLTELLNIQEA